MYEVLQSGTHTNAKIKIEPSTCLDKFGIIKYIVNLFVGRNVHVHVVQCVSHE